MAKVPDKVRLPVEAAELKSVPEPPVTRKFPVPPVVVTVTRVKVAVSTRRAERADAGRGGAAAHVNHSKIDCAGRARCDYRPQPRSC